MQAKCIYNISWGSGPTLSRCVIRVRIIFTCTSAGRCVTPLPSMRNLQPQWPDGIIRKWCNWRVFNNIRPTPNRCVRKSVFTRLCDFVPLFWQGSFRVRLFWNGWSESHSGNGFWRPVNSVSCNRKSLKPVTQSYTNDNFLEPFENSK